jgi:hypothetical protein
MRWRHAWDIVQLASAVGIAAIAVFEREQWAIVLVAAGAVMGALVVISHRWFWETMGGWWFRTDSDRKYTGPPKPLHEFVRWWLRGRPR